jgi:hypothetical protein
VPAFCRFLGGHDHRNEAVLNAGAGDVGEKLALGVFEITFFRKNRVRVYSVDFFVGLFRRAASQCDCRLSFPAADFDDHPLALTELPELKEAINLSRREHTGQMIDIVELFRDLAPMTDIALDEQDLKRLFDFPGFTSYSRPKVCLHTS